MNARSLIKINMNKGVTESRGKIISNSLPKCTKILPLVSKYISTHGNIMLYLIMSSKYSFTITQIQIC